MLPAFCGALVGGFFTILGGWFSHRWQQQSLERKERKTFRNVLKAFKQELAILWKNYENIIGSEIESIKKGEYLDRQYVMTQEYFTVYKNNVSIFSKLENENLQESIINTYLSMCHLLDTIGFNNKILASYEKHYMEREGTGATKFVRSTDRLKNVLIQQVYLLKSHHKQAKNLINELLPQLDRTIESL